MSKAREIMERLDDVDVDHMFDGANSSYAFTTFKKVSYAILGYECDWTFQQEFEDIRDALREAFDELEARAMPEGFEWPRYEGGGLVRFGDEVADSFGDKFEEPVVSIEFFEKGFTLYGGRSQRFYGYEERVERFSPKVLASDGEPLEAGQTVYATHYGYAKCTVLAIEWAVDGYLVEVENEGGHKFRQTPYDFTHTKPEPPDSWERLEDDATVSPETYCVRRGIDIADVDGTHLVLDDVTERMARDIVRRAKALAGVSE